jgi:hypothetical protein
MANDDFDCTTPGNALLAPAGTRLPVTAKFKGNAIGRYEFPLRQLGRARPGGAGLCRQPAQRPARPAERDQGQPARLHHARRQRRRAGRSTGSNCSPPTCSTATAATPRRCNARKPFCGDPTGVSGTGPVFYDYTIKPRTVGLKIGVDF